MTTALAVALAGSARSAGAQITVGGSVDAALARAQHRLRPRFDAGMLAVGAHVATRQTLLSASGALTTAVDSLGVALTTLGAGYQPARLPWVRIDASMGLAAFGVNPSGIPNSSRGGSSLAALSGTFMRALPFGSESVRGALAVGYADGRSRRTFIDNFGRGIVKITDDFEASSLVASLGLEHRFGRIGMVVERQRTNDYDLLEDSGFGLRREASAYDLRDVTLAATARAWRVEAGVSHSARRGVVHTVGRADATSVSLGVRLTDGWSVQGTTGRQIADVLRGIAPARVSMVALRWQFGTRGASVTRSRGAETTVVDGAVEVRVAGAPGARVEIAGSWNDWTPVVLARDGDRFVGRVSLPSGAHRIAIRVDGGAWRAPKGLARVSDEFGGEAGILVVP